MALKTLQASVSLLLFSACLNFITDIRTAAISIREKCQCVEETDSVPWRKITDYTIIPKDSFCNKIQIILQLSNKQSCLNPNSKPGQRLQKCWKRIKFNTERKSVCLKRQKTKGSKRPKNN